MPKVKDMREVVTSSTQIMEKTYFITLRLHKSIPLSILRECKGKYVKYLERIKNSNSKITSKKEEFLTLRKRYFAVIDRLLDNRSVGPRFFVNDEIAEICKEQIHRFDGELYKLGAYSIMKNHVHLVITLNRELEHGLNTVATSQDDRVVLEKALSQMRGAVARLANLKLGRIGMFWAKETYDIKVRDSDMLENVIRYTLDNPVKAGFVKEWSDYKHAYVCERFRLV